MSEENRRGDSAKPNPKVRKRLRRWLKKGIGHEIHKNCLRDDSDCGVVVFTSHIAICEESEGVIGVDGRK